MELPTHKVLEKMLERTEEIRRQIGKAAEERKKDTGRELKMAAKDKIGKIDPKQFAGQLKEVAGEALGLVDSVSDGDAVGFARHILGKAREAAMKGLSAKKMHLGTRQGAGIGVGQIAGMFKKMLASPMPESEDQGMGRENRPGDAPSPSRGPGM